MVSGGELLAYGISPSCLSDAAASKMYDLLAIKLFSGRYFIMIDTGVQGAIYSVGTSCLGGARTVLRRVPSLSLP